jgi:hypothetical protein
MTGLDARFRLLTKRALGVSAIVGATALGACTDRSTPATAGAPVMPVPNYGYTQEDRAMQRGGTSGNVAAPIVPGTGRITGGLGNADVQRAPAAPGTGAQAPIVPGTGRITGGLGDADVQRQGGGAPR